MKYASRHVLYPVPNVLESLVVGRRDARVVFVVAVRARVVLVAVRAEVFLLERVVAVREVLVAVRATVGRVAVACLVSRTRTVCGALVRETVFTCFVVVRAFETFWFAAPREIVDASRTAAYETPMPIKHAKTTGNTFLILSMKLC